jgi:ankyrin repeat protein
VRAGRANIAALLVERGAQVRARDKRGFTALHYAAQNGMNDTARLLLDRGATVDARAGTGGYTPLHLAIIASRDDTALLLVERGASLTQRTGQGFTALDIAMSRNEDKLAAAIEDAEAQRAGR